MASSKAYGITRLSKEKLLKVLALKSLEQSITSLISKSAKLGFDSIRREKEQKDASKMMFNKQIKGQNSARSNTQIARFKLMTIGVQKLRETVKGNEQRL